MSEVDRERIEADWARRGFSCRLWVDEPGARWEDFVHPTDELVVVIDGDIEFEFGGELMRPRPGEELLIPARAVHSVRNVGSATSHWLYGYRRS